MPEKPFNSKARAASPRMVLGGRALLLLLAAGAAVFAFVHDRREERSGAAASAYTCPMHPEVRAAGPGRCPICGMALEEPMPRSAGDDVVSPPQGLFDLARWRTLPQQVRAPASAHGGGVIQALLSADELSSLAPGQRGVFRPAAAPAVAAGVRLAARPPAPWDGTTSRVEFQLDARAPALRPGTAGWVELPAGPRHLLVIPSAAVLQSAEGPFALALSPDSRALTRRPLQIGRTPGALSIVVSGLDEGERVAVRGAFFLDAERRLADTGSSAAAGAR